MTWDFQYGKWQVVRWEDIFTTGDGTSKMEVAGSEMGRQVYHRRWDVQNGKWQAMRWEDEFTTCHGTSKQDMGLPRWEVAGIMRWEDEFTTGDGTPKMGSGR